TASFSGEIDALREALSAAQAEREALKAEVDECHRLLQSEIDRINAPCAESIEWLWNEWMLKRKPNYGPWEYPAQAMRHVLDEFREVEAALAEARARVVELEKLLQDMLDCVLSADEARLLMVGTNAPAMSRHDGPGPALHARCDRIRAAT